MDCLKCTYNSSYMREKGLLRWNKQKCINTLFQISQQYWEYCVNLMQITGTMAALLQSYSSAKAPHTECRVERLCKCSLDSVQKLHAIRDAVKCKYSCSMIQVDANTRWHWSRNIFALVVVHKGEFGVGAVQAPGLVVPAQAAFIAISFAADSPVGNGHVYLRSPPVHLPVTASPSHALPAQHLERSGWNERLKDKLLLYAWLITAV